MTPPWGNDGMTEGRKDGMTESGIAQPKATKDKTLSVAEVVGIFTDAFKESFYPELHSLAILDLFRGSVLSLGHYLKKGKVAGVNWKNPFALLDYPVGLIPSEEVEDADLEAVGKERLTKDAALDLLGRITVSLMTPDFLVPATMHGITREVAVAVAADGDARIILPPALEDEVAALPEAEQEDRLDALGAGFDLPPLSFTGTCTTPAGKESFTAALVFGIKPLVILEAEDRAFFPVLVGLDFKEGDPSAWSEEDRQAILDFLVGQLDALAAPYLKAVEAKGEDRPAVPEPDRAVAVRAEYFHAPGRLFDTPRHAAAHQDTLPAIGRWYVQTAFNRTVGMAAAALTKTDTRDAILDWQSATVAEVADLVFCRSEEGALAHGQNREDILKAFESLRAIPVPIVRIDWKKVGTDRNPRWVKEYKLQVASLLQSYGAVFVDKDGKEVHAGDPAQKKHLVKGKPDRRKTLKALVAQNPADGILESFPPDRYTLTRFEWRWNTDIAEDFICPQVALDGKGRPRRALKGRPHIEGSRFINLNRRYFAVQKHLRDAGSKYAPRLLDLIVSEKTHITSRGKGAVWIEIQADKVIKALDLWVEYRSRPKHVLEDHIAPAVMALIREKVMLPESWLVPQLDKNPDRRKTAFFRWKVAELWSTVALVPPDEAKDIEAELVKEAEAAEVARSQPAPDAQPKTDQAVLPGMEEPPAQPIPDGSVIRAARDAAGLNLRDFARRMDGRDAVLHGKEAPKPSFKTWSLIETGQRTERSGRIPEAVWNRVRDFVAQHGPKADLSHDGSESVT